MGAVGNSLGGDRHGGHGRGRATTRFGATRREAGAVLRPRPPGHGEVRATLSVTGMPELLARLQHRLADLLRARAEDEAPAVADRLRAIAATFETGQATDLERE